MKRTLLAVGVAVLTSMMLIPRGVVTVERYGHVQEGDIQEFLPFFLYSQQQYKNHVAHIHAGDHLSRYSRSRDRQFPLATKA